MERERANRAPRKVAIADHLWEAFEEMAERMGSDRDGLINQAMFMFARLNGFLESILPPEPVHTPPPPPPPREPAPAPQSAAPAEDERADDREEGGVDTGSDLEEAIRREKGSGPAYLGYAISPDDDRDDLEDESERDRRPIRSIDEEADRDDGGLFLLTETGEERVDASRFLIGRGKHCDFVINSGKVSREHAAIVREGEDWYIEDLGSSNGTWFNKQRIRRRKIEHGDEYFVCSESIRFEIR